MNKLFFCDVCQEIMKMSKDDYSNNILICECGFLKKLDDSLFISEKINNKEVGEKIEEESLTKGFPHVCKKCGYGECEIFDLGAPYSDESNVYLYKCKKCKFVQRQADGTSNK